MQIPCTRHDMQILYLIFVPSFLYTFFQQGVIVISTGEDSDYHYLVTVITGWQRNAGTSATVAMDMVGSLGVIETLVLADPTRCVHESGAETWFLIATDETLGELSELRVWHDCSGIFPSWFVTIVSLSKPYPLYGHRHLAAMVLLP